MAALCDVFVMDAFGTAHRAEASTHGVAQFAPVACAGPLLVGRTRRARDARSTQPARPLVADRRRLQGLDQARRCSRSADRARSTSSWSAAASPTRSWRRTGMPVGKSLHEPDMLDVARRLLERARGARRRRYRCRSTSSSPREILGQRQPRRSESATGVAADEMILDIGPDTAARGRRRSSSKAGTVIWNGPLGVFEFEQFGEGTRALAQAIARQPGVLDRRAAAIRSRRSRSTASARTSPISRPAAARSSSSSRARRCRRSRCSNSARQG